MENNKKTLGIFAGCLVALVVIISIPFSLAVEGYKSTRKPEKTITVTGSAKKQIKSDLVVWRGSISAQSKQLIEAYNKLNKDLASVKEYIKSKQIPDKEISVLSISTYPIYAMMPNGIATSNVESYKLTQDIEIKSTDIEKVTDVSRQITSLINQGIEFQSMPPQYMYTKIADIKVDMLALATKDAKNRVEQIAKNAGSNIESLKSAKMGVFQITPLYSTDVSDSGLYDTTSIEKEITGVVNCVFLIK